MSHTSTLIRRLRDARARHYCYRKDLGLSTGLIRTSLGAFAMALAPRRRIFVHPGSPGRWSVLAKICVVLRYEILCSPGSDVAVWYEDTTFPDGDRSVLPAGLSVINGECFDISKRRVEAVGERVLGYSLGVDPTTYMGQMVEKSDENYRHDGAIISGPIPEPRSGRTYQRYVDAREGDVFVDYRTHVSGGEIPVVYRKAKSIGPGQFTDDEIEDVSVVDAAVVFSVDERARLVRLCAELGADFAELDVLRDRDSGRIYVVDVNTTPSGPRVELSTADRVASVRRMADAFERLVASKVGGLEHS